MSTAISASAILLFSVVVAGARSKLPGLPRHYLRADHRCVTSVHVLTVLNPHRVFTLYGDTALSDAMRVSLEIALAIPMTDLLAYQKVARSYYTLMDILCANHAQSIVAVDHEVFVHIVRTVQEGLSAPEVWTQCATALDHLSEFR